MGVVGRLTTDLFGFGLPKKILDCLFQIVLVLDTFGDISVGIDILLI